MIPLPATHKSLRILLLLGAILATVLGAALISGVRPCLTEGRWLETSDDLQREARAEVLNLARGRLAVTYQLIEFLEAPKFKTNAPETWSFNSREGFERFIQAQAAIEAFVQMLVANTDGLAHPEKRVEAHTTYGRKILEARRLLAEYQALTGKIEDHKKRARISTEDFSPTESK